LGVLHSASDTLDKIDPATLAQWSAATVWLTWSLADADGHPRSAAHRTSGSGALTFSLPV